MNKITIKDNKTGLCSVILPDYGAMVCELRTGETDVLNMNYGMLGIGNVLSGGIPLLFPFAGKSPDDTLVFNGKRYAMPMHGFAKDLPFDIAAQSGASCTLAFSANEMTKTFYFPFDFKFTVTYTTEGQCFSTRAALENKSREPIPVALGFHPYFLTTCREKTEFKFDLKNYYDYTKGVDAVPARGTIESELKLSEKYDHVFYAKAGLTMSLQNPADGYAVNIITDNSFNIATISTGAKNSSCLEPWQSFPNVLGSKEFWQWVPAGGFREFTYQIVIEQL